MTGDILSDYERKRDRALHHLDVLRGVVNEFSNADRPPVLGEYLDNTGHYRFRMPLQPSDPEWPLIVGDFLHNAHASLDYLITALIRSTGGEEHNQSLFPIATPDEKRSGSWLEVERDWDQDPRNWLARRLAGTPSSTKDTLKPLQPFYGGLRTDPHRHPLFVLHTLSNREKHRRLNVLARRAIIDFVYVGGERIFPHGPPTQITRVGEPDARNAYTVAWETKKHDRAVFLQIGYSVGLDEAPVIGELVATLEGICEFIDNRVVPTIRRLL